MILKEKKVTHSKDPKISAGEKAEKQMAFYLKRSFGNSPDYSVINDLRISHKNDVAQLDHLVITKFGLFIIESKSVHGEIKVNKNHEWSRTYRSKIEGMPSPVIQANSQAEIIKKLLIRNKDSLRSKLLLGTVQKGFKYCPINILVAISDKGIIERGAEVPELLKADQITGVIREKFKSLKKQNSLLSINLDPVWDMTGKEVFAVEQFLLNQHTPLIKENFSAKPANKKVSNSKHFIPKVGATCPQCNQQELVRKSISRSDGSGTDFLACSAYPKHCKGIYALVAVPYESRQPDQKSEIAKELQANDSCPDCSLGKLVPRKGKTEFLGCSTYPKCKFTSYKYNA